MSSTGTIPKTFVSSSLSSSTKNSFRFFSLSMARRRKRNSISSPRIACASSSAAAADENDVASPKPWLFVGLGNPGKIYQGTRHNVGFEMVDAIAEAEGISISSIRSKALFGKGYIGDVPIMLAKPQTFMNASGESVSNSIKNSLLKLLSTNIFMIHLAFFWSVKVGSLVSYFKIPLNQVLVMYDDMDLPFAKLRLLPKGGHGGHNGMRSVITHLKRSREIPRLKIGIGRPPGKMDPVNFVLRPFNKKEKEELEFTYQKGLEAARILVLEGFNKSATFTNSAQPSELMNR